MKKEKKQNKVLFVCLGNICRSPAAEGVMLHLLQKEGRSEEFMIDSAGTSDWHEGELADPRMREHALRRGIKLTSRSRPFEIEDFKNFDFIVVMDDQNYRDILSLDQKGQYLQKVKKMASYIKNYDVKEIPDPYYGGPQGFDFVLDILEDGCRNMLEHGL